MKVEHARGERGSGSELGIRCQGDETRLKRCASSKPEMVEIRVDERLAITGCQVAELEVATVWGHVRDAHLLQIAACTGGSGNSEVDEIRSAKIFGSQIAGK